MIYAYLTPDSSVTIYTQMQGSNDQFKSRPQNLSANNRVTIPAYPLPYQPDEDAIGNTFAKELCEYFPRHTRFHFDIDSEPDAIETSFRNSLFTFPIRNFSFDIDLSRKMYSRMVYTGATKSHMVHRCMRSLNQLIKLPAQNAKLELGVSTRHNSLKQSQGFRKICILLLPRLAIVRDAGYSITLVVDALLIHSPGSA